MFDPAKGSGVGLGESSHFYDVPHLPTCFRFSNAVKRCPHLRIRVTHQAVPNGVGM